MSESDWSQWYPLEAQSDSVPVPDLPGIYEIRTDRDFGRLRGSSRVVYIGSAARGGAAALLVDYARSRTNRRPGSDTQNKMPH